MWFLHFLQFESMANHHSLFIFPSMYMCVVNRYPDSYLIKILLLIGFAAIFQDLLSNMTGGVGEVKDNTRKSCIACLENVALEQASGHPLLMCLQWKEKLK